MSDSVRTATVEAMRELERLAADLARRLEGEAAAPPIVVSKLHILGDKAAANLKKASRPLAGGAS